MRSDAHGVQALNVLVRRDGWQAFNLRERGVQHCIAAGGCGVMARWQGTSAGALVRLVPNCLLLFNVYIAISR